MKKILLALFIALISITAFSQKTKISIGIESSATHGKYNFNNIDGFPHNYETFLNQSFGLRFRYYQTKVFSITSGLLYSKKGYKLNYNWIAPDGSNGIGDPAITMESSLRVNYLEFPIIANYTFYNSGKIKFNSSTGILLSFLIKENETSIYGDDSETESQFLNQNLNNLLFSIPIILGFEYHFSNRLFLSLEPNLFFNLKQIDKEILKPFSFSYGGTISISYKI